MDRTDNIVVLAEVRLNKLRLVKERGMFVKNVHRLEKQASCTVHVLREPPTPESD